MQHRIIVVLVVLFIAGCGGPTMGGSVGRTDGEQHGPASSNAPRARDAAPPTCAEQPPPSKGGSPPKLVLQTGHTQMISGVMLSADGSRMASAGMDGIARIWDTKSGLLLRRVRTASDNVGLAFSADGKTLATFVSERKDGKVNFAIEVRDLGSGRAPTVIKQPSFLFALTPDGSKIAIAIASLSANTGVELYDTRSGAKLGRAAFGAAHALTMDTAAKRLAAAAGDELIVMALPAMTITHRFKNPAYQSNKDRVGDLALHGDQLWLRSDQGAVARVDLGSKQIASTLPGNHFHMALGKDTLWTLEMPSGKTLGWRASDGGALGAQGSAHKSARKIAASADGRTLAMATTNPFEGFDLLVRDAGSGVLLRTMKGINSALSSIAISPNGRRIATSSHVGVITRWDTATGKLEGVSEMRRSVPAALAFDDTGTILVGATGTAVRTFEASTGRVTRQWDAHPGSTTHVSFLPKGSKLVTAGWDGAVRIWDLAGRQPAAQKQPPLLYKTLAAPAKSQPIAELPMSIVRASLSRHGDLLAVLGSPGKKLPGLEFYSPAPQALEVALIDMKARRVRWQKPLGKLLNTLSHIALSPDGKSVLVSVYEHKVGHEYLPVLKIFDATSGKVRETRPLEEVTPLAFLDSTLAIGGKQPSLQAWPGPSKRRPLALPDVDITVVAADHKRKRFVFGGNSGATSLTDETGKIIAVMVNTPDGEFVTTTLDGAFVSSLDGRRSVGWSFLKPLEGFSFAQFSERYERPDVVAARLASGSGNALTPLARPPRLHMSAVPARAGARVEVSASVASPRRVERVRAYVNARPVVDELVCAPNKKVKLDVPLEPGNNRVTLIAYDADGHASAPASRDVQSRVKAPPPDLWAVAIGVSRYPRLKPDQQLEYADDDARAIVAALKPLAGGHFNELHATTLIDDEVTPDSVAAALKPLARMKPHDLAVVFMAGHGLRLADGNMVLLTPKADLTGAGAKAGGIGWDRIEASLGAARGRVLLLLDACHSGHVSTELIVPNEALATRLARDNRAGVLIFAASRGSQLSYEVGPPGTQGATRGLQLVWGGAPPRVTIPRTGHGLFTSAVIEALKGKATDRDRSGGIELGELTSYVTERVREASNGMQTPWVVRQELFGDFLIAPAGR